MDTTRGLAELIAVLDGADVRRRMQVMIDDLGGVSELEATALCASMEERMHGIASSLRDVCYEDDVSEAVATLPWIWLELRFEWMRYNLQMQYQTMLRGTAEPALMARGAALSHILEVVELHLDADAAFVVSKIAADPKGTAHGAIERTDRLFALMADASAGGRDAVESLLFAQDQISRHTDSVPVQHELSKAISSVIEKIGGALMVTVTDFTLALEGAVIRELGGAPVRVVLNQSSPDPSVRVPTAVANGLLKAATDWFRALGSTSLSQDATSRLAAGRAAFVTVHASLEHTGDRVQLTLTDDADGTVEYRPQWRLWPIRDFKLLLTQSVNQGSCIRFGCYVTAIAEYMVLRVGEQEDDAYVGVPIRMVDHIERRERDALALHGQRLINRSSGDTLPVVDLGEALFGRAIDGTEATYVHVHPDGRDGICIALRVLGVDGICRGSIKGVPALLSESPLRGFVQADLRLIAVLDFDRLLGRALPDDGVPLEQAA